MNGPVVTGWIRIQAPYFTAGLSIKADKVVSAAPIINYMRGWSYYKVKTYCERKRWKLEWID